MRRRINIKTDGGDSALPASGEVNFSSEEVDIDDSDSHSTLCCENIRIRPGVRLMVANHVRNQRIQMDYEIDRAPVSFCFSLSQRMRLTMRHGLRSTTVVERVPGDSVLAYLPETRGTVEIFPDRRVAGVSLHFSVPAFRELFPSPPECLAHLDTGANSPSKNRQVYRQIRFSAEILHVLKQILECPYTGDIRGVFLEAKTLELAALKMAAFAPKHPAEPREFGRLDIDRIKEAYHILLTRLDHPPSLVDLGRTVGLNRNKLNGGFKALYGETAFTLLRRARLSKARSLLDNSDLSLSEIAFAVGYNSQANFTTAFRRYFGSPPNAFRR